LHLRWPDVYQPTARADFDESVTGREQAQSKQRCETPARDRAVALFVTWRSGHVDARP